MPTHCVSYHQEPDGAELVDIDYQCGYSCMIDTLAKNAPYALAAPVEDKTVTGWVAGILLGDTPTPTAHAGTANSPDGGSVSWGACPGGAETDYAVYCSGCGDKLWSGLQDDADQ
jgi:hypothetical protein